MVPKFLVVDNDQASVDAIIEGFKREDYDLFTASDMDEALQTLVDENINVVIMAENMSDSNEINPLKCIKDDYPCTQVILTGNGSIEATRAEADGYLKKPIEIDILRQTAKNVLEKRLFPLQDVNPQGHLDDKFGFANIIGTSKPMRKLFHMIRLVAPTNATVLIHGESGVGKELIANAIHNHSRRQDKPYRTINCGALYRELLESELFGHERGAFTGATTRKLGLFEQANGGTLLLDEVGEMGPETQVKFLRVLEGKEFTRLGGDKPIKTDVRVIAATNADLEKAVENGKFRKDLYHRINRFPIRVTPLTERREDIPLLVSAFIKEFSKEHKRPASAITPQAMDYLKNAAWDGNIRELRNAIETAIILTEAEILELDDFQNARQSESEKSSTPVKKLFEYPVAVFCKLCSTNNNLRLSQLTEWIQDEIEDHRDLVDKVYTEIDSWGSSREQLSREQLVEKLKEVVQNTIEHLSDLLKVPVPKPVSIKEKTLDSCLVAVFEFFIAEYNKDRAQAAKALGMRTEQDMENVKERLDRSIQNREDKEQEEKGSEKGQSEDDQSPKLSNLKPFPIEEVESLARRSVDNFLGEPTTGQQLEMLDEREKLRCVRLALSVLSRRLDGDYGSICIGGMTYKEIETEIYRRATYLYATQQDVADALAKDRGTVTKELAAIRRSSENFPSGHTLF